MPIKPENRSRYPKDWPEIHLAILERAKYRCEWPGCGAGHHHVGYWRGEQFVRMPQVLKDAGYKAGDIVICSDRSELKLLRIVLTIAHKDHTPEHCHPDNLAAWCQRHHLAYDQEHHKTTAYMSRKQRACTLELPL
ncbi:hypothetical protein [Rhodoferax fermentans]|uniref:HNH endonuclease n=1 Tax=Rhodoferax fermentans TaxID=28066 RepID=A0A1T1APH0_RHOFE|nr:hypothetical protein [Rhodoferax fermentans]MBK1683406.1 hypothetical protein [Rhodoferax fermentans]OOV05848.1 hypothetical protein RF819_03190 [Rhodoferax fermentans]